MFAFASGDLCFARHVSASSPVANAVGVVAARPDGGMARRAASHPTSPDATVAVHVTWFLHHRVLVLTLPCASAGSCFR